ncbi:hypothetical protein Tco_0318891 [Tanacetum coccineum]
MKDSNSKSLGGKDNNEIIDWTKEFDVKQPYATLDKMDLEILTGATKHDDYTSVSKFDGSNSEQYFHKTVKESAMIKSNQTWRPKEAYLDSVNRDNGSYTLKQFEAIQKKISKTSQLIDRGLLGSMTGDKDKLSDFKEFKGGYVAFGNDSKGGRISGKGTIKTSCIDFEKVSYVEELKFNLLSVSQICDKKHNVLFTDKECLILSPKFKFD